MGRTRRGGQARSCTRGWRAVIASELFRGRNCKWCINPSFVTARSAATRQSMQPEFMDCHASLAMTARVSASPHEFLAAHLCDKLETRSASALAQSGTATASLGELARAGQSRPWRQSWLQQVTGTLCVALFDWQACNSLAAFVMVKHPTFHLLGLGCRIKLPVASALAKH